MNSPLNIHQLFPPSIFIHSHRICDYPPPPRFRPVCHNGLAFRRTRSAVCSSSVCMLASLSYSDLAELRKQSPFIDAAVREAVAQIRATRPGLFGSTGETGDSGGGGAASGVEQRFQKLTQLNAQMAELQGQIATQMSELQLEIHSMSQASDPSTE